MKLHTVLASGSIAAALGLAFAAVYAERPESFDPLFDSGAVCGAPSGGAAPLLKKLVLAQAETRPFKPGQQRPAAPDAAMPPLYAHLGSLHMAVTTRSPKAQAYFDQGLRLAYGFNHAEAARAFRAAQQIDPNCAMCYWGEALVLGPNINAPMFPEAVAPAAAAAAKSVRLQ